MNLFLWKVVSYFIWFALPNKTIIDIIPSCKMFFISNKLKFDFEISFPKKIFQFFSCYKKTQFWHKNSKDHSLKYIFQKNCVILHLIHMPFQKYFWHNQKLQKKIWQKYFQDKSSKTNRVMKKKLEKIV